MNLQVRKVLLPPKVPNTAQSSSSFRPFRSCQQQPSGTPLDNKSPATHSHHHSPATQPWLIVWLCMAGHTHCLGISLSQSHYHCLTISVSLLVSHYHCENIRNAARHTSEKPCDVTPGIASQIECTVSLALSHSHIRSMAHCHYHAQPGVIGGNEPATETATETPITPGCNRDSNRDTNHTRLQPRQNSRNISMK